MPVCLSLSKEEETIVLLLVIVTLKVQHLVYYVYLV